jgi:hypothetical protein
MAPLKQKGDLAELMVAADLRRRGYKLAIPFGDTTSDGSIVVVICRSHSLTNGRVRATKYYTAATIDWIAVWEATTGTPYYVPSSVFDGFSDLTLRLTPTRNGQSKGIRHAADFLEI